MRIHIVFFYLHIMIKTDDFSFFISLSSIDTILTVVIDVAVVNLVAPKLPSFTQLILRMFLIYVKMII